MFQKYISGGVFETKRVNGMYVCDLHFMMYTHILCNTPMHTQTTSG